MKLSYALVAVIAMLAPPRPPAGGRYGHCPAERDAGNRLSINPWGLLIQRAREFEAEIWGYEPNPDGSERTPKMGFR